MHSTVIACYTLRIKGKAIESIDGLFIAYFSKSSLVPKSLLHAFPPKSIFCFGHIDITFFTPLNMVNCFFNLFFFASSKFQAKKQNTFEWSFSLKTGYHCISSTCHQEGGKILEYTACYKLKFHFLKVTYFIIFPLLIGVFPIESYF